jgi:mannosidase alpha-like ER degradation enhancer 1
LPTHMRRYLEVGKAMYTSLQRYARVSTGGFASIRDVATMTQEDHQQSFFLAETCKYLYLLFNNR